MKIRYIDAYKGIIKVDLSERTTYRKEKKREGNVNIQAPPLWIPSPEKHDPEGRNERR